jgi:hypothetical protein
LIKGGKSAMGRQDGIGALDCLPLVAEQQDYTVIVTAQELWAKFNTKTPKTIRPQ